MFSVSAAAQVDTVQGSPRLRQPVSRLLLQADSLLLARQAAVRDSLKARQDSVRAVQDSLSMIYLKAPDPDRPHPFLDSLLEVNTVKDLDFAGWARKFPKKVNRMNEGRSIPKREPWVIFSVLFLVAFFAVLKNAFPKELESIFQSFYDNRMLGKISQEDNVLGSRPFLFFYLLFGLTIAMFLYLAGKYLQLEYSSDGIEWFLILSALIMGLFALKIVVLRLLAVLFDLGKVVKQYTSILYISYFNAAFVFLPLVVGFSLSSYEWGSIFCYAALLLVGAVFLFQIIRAATLVLSEYQFSKVYLIIYLCALEICPLLILVKALRF
ncbi:MAG TPA: DUF4271 domain-containing protein [Sphingobacteriaceae bacterium]